MKVEVNYRITLPTGFIVECAIFYKQVLISIARSIFPRDLIKFNLSDFDIILAMNWLHNYEAKIDCKDLKVTLKDEKDREVCFYRQREETPHSIICAVKASKLLGQDCIGYWCYAVEVYKK